ncbi:2-amino-4-hydroxy-6-hydroxymethyldihydropteridine diphosphokinase [Bacillus luteolus]|uniref:2-amino-4-hydroxy-6-hydroxymethyldihydropteridine diphosphokinase n=1 Tax=Litchfieldia luteola TaxID=682179 RepID=A0ABR9QDX1_9BACI|nr:2-amino-4-hydroxy-6-hydroxymethyldihydropteridine diphosphokinase [Cytobacillus luteolus]MBE4906693.1 2-amino-4-hydroxy-6-hydroxymethyldihydropteridine diphosphokinase [Cytobacillus luteolus]MBP1944390.1 2-amino-4-hydroxy-6-hydroxymethyldihydropteridine diphosphokinase [Cytobacillus luteolus]
MSNIAYIAIGSNIENRLEHLRQAVHSLNNHKHIHVEKGSSIYETDPVGYEDQAPFLNMVIKVITELSMIELLRANQVIETENGRKREIKWGPRTLDLDILLYNHENIETEELIIPHPRMTERAFVMIPLLEVEQNVVIPTHELAALNIDELRDREGVRVWKQKNGEDVYELFEN